MSDWGKITYMQEIKIIYSNHRTPMYEDVEDWEYIGEAIIGETKHGKQNSRS